MQSWIELGRTVIVLTRLDNRSKVIPGIVPLTMERKGSTSV